MASSQLFYIASCVNALLSSTATFNHPKVPKVNARTLWDEML